MVMIEQRQRLEMAQLKTLRISQREGDRNRHVGYRHFRNNSSIYHLHHRVDDTLRMNQHRNLLGFEVEEPVRFDNLKPLVHESRGIDCNLIAHLPRRMLQRVFDCNARESFRWPLSEWST